MLQNEALVAKSENELSEVEILTIFAELVMNKVSANLGRLRRHPRPQLVQGPRPEEDGGKD